MAASQPWTSVLTLLRLWKTLLGSYLNMCSPLAYKRTASFYLGPWPPAVNSVFPRLPCSYMVSWIQLCPSNMNGSFWETCWKDSWYVPSAPLPPPPSLLPSCWVDLKQPSWTMRQKPCAEGGRAWVPETMQLSYLALEWFFYRMRKKEASVLFKPMLFFVTCNWSWSQLISSVFLSPVDIGVLPLFAVTLTGCQVFWS